MTPTHLIILLALGLWLGQHVPLRLGLPLKVFAPLSAAALALTATHWIDGVPVAVRVAVALAMGAIVALKAGLPSCAGAGLVAAAAFAIGLDSGVDNGTAPLAGVATLLGTWVSLNLGLINIAYYVSLAAERKKQWIDIGLRIVGSWIFAISLLMLAFSWRSAHPA
jgi:urease accessory protein